MGRIRTNLTNRLAARAGETLVEAAKWLLSPDSRRRFGSMSKRVLAWFRARNPVVQIAIVLFALAFSWVLWSVLIVVVGFLLRAVVWRWLKAEALARLLGWGRRLVLPGS